MLDEEVFFDAGVSAHRGANRENPDKHALAAFLQLVERRRIPAGSYLIVESLDRLSRETGCPALSLLLQLIEKGIRIVQLSPSEHVYDKDSGPMSFILAIMELGRGHSESEMKSVRIGSAWRRKREDVRARGALYTQRLPAWLTFDGSRIVPIEERAETLRRIYTLAAGGHGANRIIRVLAKEGRLPFGERVVRDERKRSAFAGHWTAAYVNVLLRDRRLIGEMQPKGKGRKPDGPPVPGYYPRVIEQPLWDAVERSLRLRKRTLSRDRKLVHLFAGLVVDALTGEHYHYSMKGTRVLINADAINARATARTYPESLFDDALLAHIRELTAADVSPGNDQGDEIQRAAAEFTRLETRIAEVSNELLNGDSIALSGVLRKLEARKEEVGEQLAELRQLAASPASEALGDAQAIAGRVAPAPDDDAKRIPLRSAIRRLVDRVYVVVCPRGRDTFLFAQIHYQGGVRRCVYALYRIPGNRRAGGHWSESVVDASANAIDLRNPDDARAVFQTLSGMDIRAETARLMAKAGGCV